MVIKNQDTGKMSPDPENVSETETRGRRAPATWGWALSRLPSAALSHLQSLLPYRQGMNLEREMRDGQLLP